MNPGFVGPEACRIFVAVFVKKNTKKYEYKIDYESEYLIRAPPRGLEEARASEGPWSLSFISFTVNPPSALNTTNESWSRIHVTLNQEQVRLWNMYENAVIKGLLFFFL